MENTDSGKNTEKKTRTIWYEDGTKETFELRQISDEELRQTLDAHRIWVGTNMNKGQEADLVFTDLSGRRLRRKFLSKINLEGVSFRDSDLTEANLDNSSLERADLQDAKMIRTSMKEADLLNADFSGANLRGAQLQHAVMESTCFVGAKMQQAKMENATLIKINLQDAALSGTMLQNAFTEEIVLTNANLKRANLQNAWFEKADCSGACLEYADFTNANLGQSNLKGADLRGSIFDGTNVAGVKYDRQAKYQGIRVSTCHGSAMFKAFAQHQDFIEELRDSGKKGNALYHVWNIFADCGRTPWRWLLWSLFFSLFFAMCFFYMGESHFSFSNKSDAFPFGFIAPIYYSVVTFTTLGFGDITPKTPIAAILVMAEVILGYVMLGGLISIFATLITRRS
ncbi:MAG: pentapeptide repeat-containing protein [Desulfatibacillum sp.]|nr:pentapeptide repeat-containing protein [Desulfatibacillum sp.]